MSILTVHISKPWQIRLPILIRYLESKWIDHFFDSGELMLSSFSKFRKHPDEQRGDVHEGKALLEMDFGGQPLTGIGFFGHDAYVLSTSMIESEDLMKQFPGADSFFRIRDSIAFATSIATVLPGFALGYQGSCIYRPHRTVRRKVDGPPLFPPPSDAAGVERAAHEIQQRVMDAAALEPFFDKPIKYSHQGEYRFVWCVGATTQEHIVVKAPEARGFCERRE